MTIREGLNGKKKKYLSVFLAGMLVFLGSIILGPAGNTPPWFAFAGFVVALLAIMAAILLIRCPKCNGNLGYILINSGTPFAISKSIRFCPYCGVNLDDRTRV